MNFSKIGMILLLITSMCYQSDAQSLVLANGGSINPLYSPNHKIFSAIVVDGKTLVKPDSANGPLNLNGNFSGTISVSTVDRIGKELKPITPIGFMVAAKNNRTNTVWMLTDKVVYKAEIEDLLKKCEWGDKLIFMAVDPQYSLPRNEVVTMDGC